MIIPCIDLMNGKAVQLIRGEKKALEVEDVISLVKRFSVFREIQLIDLDSAKGHGSNISMVKNICKIAKCRVGGGIRNIEIAKSIIQADAKSIIIGSSAFIDGRVNIKFLSELISQISKKKIIIAIDSKKGKIVINGWKENTGITTESVIEELEDFCSGFLYTYVDKEGMMQGTNIEFLRKLRTLTKNEITAAGGISSLNEIKELERLGINSALGMSLYTGKIKFEELIEFM